MKNIRSYLGIASLYTGIMFAGISTVSASAITVPGHYPFIEDAINAASDGDTIVVSPGTYIENLDFNGKVITVMSSDGPDVTIIDGSNSGSVVSFVSGEPREATLRGFTIENGMSSEGGGIYIDESSPTIIANKIINNRGCRGIGISILFASSAPKIERNVISGNLGEPPAACGGSSRGGGIRVARGVFPSTDTVEIIDNLISDNVIDGGRIAIQIGTGIDFFSAGPVNVRGNIVANNLNIGFGMEGAGVSMVGSTDASFTQNLITGNCCGRDGAGIFSSPATSASLVNNTVAGNSVGVTSGTAVSVSSNVTILLLINNNIVASENQSALTCSGSADIDSNNVFAPSRNAYAGNCGDQTGLNGNISFDPLFVDPPSGDYRLQATSPVIDMGNNAAPNLPVLDFDGNLRIIDGDGDNFAFVDMGAFEFGSHLSPYTAAELIELLNATVFSFELSSGAENSLLSHLGDALAKLEDGNPNNDQAAVSLLEKFINIAEKKRDKQIPGDEVDELVAQAEVIIALIESS